jgi:peptidylprolyl isomerase
MLHLPNSMIEICKRWLKTGIVALLLLSLSVGLSGAWWNGGDTASKRESSLPAGNAITDGRALLRYALPIDNPEVRKLQQSLEIIATQVRGKRWGPIAGDIKKAFTILNLKESNILESVPPQQQAEAQEILDQVKAGLIVLQEATDVKDGEQLLEKRSELLQKVGQLEELMITEFPYEVPAEFANLPQLKGRATVEIQTNKGTIRMVADGYSAPVTAGNFIDLVQRGFYDGLAFVPSEDYVLQVGDPPGEEVGFVDPKTNEYRAIPLEILVRGDVEPTYHFTLEEIGRYREQPVLPFSAYGTVALARPEAEADGGSSQIFFFLFEPELTPAGLNLLDGRYGVFGYVVEGKEVLRQLKQGDVVESAKVIAGAKNLVQP